MSKTIKKINKNINAFNEIRIDHSLFAKWQANINSNKCGYRKLICAFHNAFDTFRFDL